MNKNSNHIRLTNLPILFDSLKIETLPADVQEKIARIDSSLPQTQCGLCDHADGCLPYAVAIVMDGEPHNKCVPGGQPVADTIAQIIDADMPILSAEPSKWPLDATSQRPVEVRAVIREDDCIGCTKCIPACPVDCIDLVTVERTLSTPERTLEQEDLRQRYHTHLNRVSKQLADSSNSRPVVSMVEAKLNNAASQSLNISEAQAKNTIAAAKLRSKIKKLEKQLSVRPNENKQAELNELKAELAQL